MKHDPQRPNWQLVIEAVEALGGCASAPQIKQYFLENFLPETRSKNVPYDSKMVTVNSPSRVHYGGGKQPRRTDTNNQYDKLFLNERKQFELYDPAKHGVWEIFKNNLGTLTVTQVAEPETDTSEIIDIEGSLPNEKDPSKGTASTPEGEGSQFAMEAHLRDYLAQNLSSISGLNTTLSLFMDEAGIPGVEYRTEAGIIDILTIGTDNNFYVIELKVGKGADAVMGQVLRYMGWVRSKLASPIQDVFGVVIANRATNKLKYAASETPKVMLLEYELNFIVRSVE
ncbi:endonuclease NucS domain-containing protein [Pseudoalteromonas gelatinilytica]|uniref:Endonuclease NucS C-terminal domain-containing protein n=1 Tax=Pseudoalteromonas gelatinilytica TaxID=1703256 RepID=A0ABQ1TXI9_9GAMM|nr:endonuclease NucS domain-containing protein [Pseudoalteromonas profundi]GGF06166.1 hypothetical protein GCM10008027_33760 [Pseudoalteromonas profundi]